MNIKWKSKILWAFICASSAISFAAGQNAITFNKYENATCQNYTGTWTGLIVAPKGAKSWPAAVSLYSTNSKIIGNIDASLELEKPHKKIWADCKNGKLANIFWGDKGECGGYSQEAFLIDQNTLILKLHYETKNEDTYFLVFLNKKNANYSLPIPTNAKDLEPGIVKTCHEKWQH